MRTTDPYCRTINDEVVFEFTVHPGEQHEATIDKIYLALDDLRNFMQDHELSLDDAQRLVNDGRELITLLFQHEFARAMALREMDDTQGNPGDIAWRTHDRETLRLNRATLELKARTARRDLHRLPRRGAFMERRRLKRLLRSHQRELETINGRLWLIHDH